MLRTAALVLAGASSVLATEAFEADAYFHDLTAQEQISFRELHGTFFVLAFAGGA